MWKKPNKESTPQTHTLPSHCQIFCNAVTSLYQPGKTRPVGCMCMGWHYKTHRSSWRDRCTPNKVWPSSPSIHTYVHTYIQAYTTCVWRGQKVKQTTHQPLTHYNTITLHLPSPEWLGKSDMSEVHVHTSQKVHSHFPFWKLWTFWSVWTNVTHKLTLRMHGARTLPQTLHTVPPSNIYH